MSGFSTKTGPNPAKQGSTIYPGFSNTQPPETGRIQRLEKGSQRVWHGSYRPTAGNYVRMPNTLLVTKPNLAQGIPVSSTGVRKVGGVSVSGNTSGFAYTSTTTTITWYWDGTNGSLVPVITRADGSRFTVPTSGSPLTISGLTANTTYYFLPFWNVNNLCNIGWVEATQGSPQIGFLLSDTTDPVNSPTYLMEQTLQQNEPLSSGFMSAATTTSGSGGGGAGGGGRPGTGCVMSGTDIVPVGDHEYSLEVIPEAEWIHIRIEDGRDLYCTYDHPLYHAVGGKMKAEGLEKGDLLITDSGEQRAVLVDFHKRKCSKYKVHMKQGHLYFANGILSHNSKPVQG